MSSESLEAAEVARIRTIKPDFWSHPKTETVTRDARLLFLGLLNEVDDEGRMRYHPKRLAGVLFPFDGDVTAEMIDLWVAQLDRAGLTARYEVEGAHYLEVPGFTEHQRINRPTPSALPVNPHDGLTELSLIPRGALTEVSRGEVEVEVEVEQGSGKELAPVARKTRRRDEVWDALMDACGISGEITNGSRGAYNRAVAGLRNAGATPDEIHRRAAVYRLRWPSASLTPTALERRWPECEVNPDHLPRPKISQAQVNVARLP